MPILIIAVVALALFVVVGAILFTAGMIERRQNLKKPDKPVSPNRAA